MEYLAAPFALCVVWFLAYVHYKISIRMGFPTSTAVVMGVLGLTGVMVIVWWWMSWPNEQIRDSEVE